RVLYNGFLSGVSLDGVKFFYVNPLASAGKHHREKWFGCACCPVNVVRLLPSLPGYQYAQDDKTIYVNLYVAGAAKVKHKTGEIMLTQETRYPWDGKVKITVSPAQPATFTLAVRTPGWLTPEPDGDALYRSPAVKDFGLFWRVNGGGKADIVRDGGYLRITREWKAGDTVEIDFSMPIRYMYAHPSVKDDVGRVALQRGPVVYCAEGADNGKDLGYFFLPPEVQLATEHKADLLGGVTVIKGKAQVRQKEGEAPQEADFTAIPYYAWDHRDPGPMAVWLAEKAEIAAARPLPTIAGTSKATASHVWERDTLDGLADQKEPKNSADESVPRLTWWDHRGTKEWVQYDFAKPAKVSAVEVYWFDDTGHGGCRTPKSWTLLANVGGQWKPVEGASPCGVEKDKFNKVTFTPVEAAGLRIEVELAPNFSGGILEWKVGG
ncbi:MAG: glycoside hydrolase family 127 protein, partial [Planctomycetota bacterium]|nr:glycoside hydrolase family 127 protein [Planctomycetota bacterium]